MSEGLAARAAVCAALYLMLCVTILPAQEGERGRENARIKARPAAASRRRPRPRPPVRVRPAQISLWVVTEPAGCRVFIDDEPRGVTDSEGELEVRLAPGVYFVRVSRESYVSKENEVDVSGEEVEQEVEFKLSLAPVTLNVVTDPPGTEIYLDDVYRGTSNPAGLLVIERVNPNQPHKLRAAKEGYQPQSMPLTSYTGQINVKLVPDSVRLRVTTDPPETEVYLNDVYKGTSTPDGLLLIEQVNPNQTHTLRAKREGYTQQSTTVQPNTPEASIKLSPDPVVLLVRGLKQKASQGRLGEAFQDYGRLIAVAPEHTELPRLLENILQGLQTRTLTMLRRTGPYGLLSELGEVQEMDSLYEQAAKWRAGDENIDQFAKYWGLKHLLARAGSSASDAEREGLLRKARAVLSDFAAQGSRNVYLLVDLGWAWWRLADKTAAQKNFQQALELKPDWAYSHFALGLLAMSEAEREVSKVAKSAKYAEAINGFTKAIELKHDFARAYALRGISYSVLNRHEEGVAGGLQAVAIEPKSAYAHFALGFAYFQKGKSGYRNALGEFDRALLLGGDELNEATRADIQQKLAVIRRTVKK
ncbi:MAG TPA: PEGA domain-containing protein [Pyrinomonadaceae bacterium]